MLVTTALLALSAGTAIAAAPLRFIAFYFVQYEDGSVEGEILGKGTKAQCEFLIHRFTKPPLKENKGRLPVRAWTEVAPDPSAMGPE